MAREFVGKRQFLQEGGVRNYSAQSRCYALSKIKGEEMAEHVPKYYDDDGTEINPDLCISCKKNAFSGEEEILCNLTRVVQQGQDEFVCEAYESNGN